MCWLQTPAEKPLLLEVQRRAGTLDAMSPAVDTSLVARDPGRILSRSVLIARSTLHFGSVPLEVGRMAAWKKGGGQNKEASLCDGMRSF